MGINSWQVKIKSNLTLCVTRSNPILKGGLKRHHHCVRAVEVASTCLLQCDIHEVQVASTKRQLLMLGT